MIKKVLCLLTLFFVTVIRVDACTIFSAKDKDGNIWTGNNEDGVLSLSDCINIVVPTQNTFGYFYFTGSKNPNDFPQGGMNDAGLFYDGNSVPHSDYRNFDKKKDYPTGNNDLIFYILKKCKSVKEVFEVFKIYRLQGLEVSQLHFADKYGYLGIITADSM